MKNNNLKHPLIEKIIFSEKEIINGIKKLANTINEKFKNFKEPILLLGILKGSGPFMFELMKHLTFDFRIDFMIVASYFGCKNKKTNKTKIILDLHYTVKDHHVIIIEDIIETGETIISVKNHLKNQETKSMIIISLLYKKTKKSIIKPDFYIFDAPNYFLVGFGLDYEEKLRNLNYIGTLKNK